MGVVSMSRCTAICRFRADDRLSSAAQPHPQVSLKEARIRRDEAQRLSFRGARTRTPGGWRWPQPASMSLAGIRTSHLLELVRGLDAC